MDKRTVDEGKTIAIISYITVDRFDYCLLYE